MITKANFMARPKIKNLPNAEKERRWKQHLMSEGGIRDESLAPRNNSTHVRGRGNFYTNARSRAKQVGHWVGSQFARLPKGTFHSAGRVLGSAFGRPDLGASAGDLLSQVTGVGDYVVRKNSIINPTANDLTPSTLTFAPDGSPLVRVQKKEPVAVIFAHPKAPEQFITQTYRIQPTDANCFKWLSGVAEHFSEWELHGAIFSYETTCSNYSAEMALGTIGIATQYNVCDTPFANMDQVLESAYSSRANPAESVLHGIECHPDLQASEHLYTRRNGVIVEAPNMYDWGIVTVALEGLPTASAGKAIGRLYVTYDVELRLPMLPLALSYNAGNLGTYSAPSTAAPPMGNFPPTIIYATKLTAGTTSGSNVLFLPASNGPSPRPVLSPDDAAELAIWCSDSSVIPSAQYLTFANPGKYNIQLTLVFTAAPPAGALFTVQTLTQYIDAGMVAPVPATALGGFVSYYVVEIVTTSSEQSISLTRQFPDSFASLCSITVCA